MRSTVLALSAALLTVSAATSQAGFFSRGKGKNANTAAGNKGGGMWVNDYWIPNTSAPEGTALPPSALPDAPDVTPELIAPLEKFNQLLAEDAAGRSSQPKPGAFARLKQMLPGRGGSSGADHGKKFDSPDKEIAHYEGSVARDQRRLQTAQAALEALKIAEEALINKGKAMPEAERIKLVRQIKFLRSRYNKDGMIRMVNTTSDRILINNKHVSSLRTIVELAAEPLPDYADIEKTAIDAKNRLEDLESAEEKAIAVSVVGDATRQADEEELSIIEEMNRRRDADELRKEQELELREMVKEIEAMPLPKTALPETALPKVPEE